MSSWRVKTGGVATCFFITVFRYRQVSKLQEKRRNVGSQAPNLFQSAPIPVPPPARAAGTRPAKCSVRTGPPNTSKGLPGGGAQELGTQGAEIRGIFAIRGCPQPSKPLSHLQPELKH